MLPPVKIYNGFIDPSFSVAIEWSSWGARPLWVSFPPDGLEAATRGLWDWVFESYAKNWLQEKIELTQTASVSNFISTIQQMSVSWLTRPLWVKTLPPLPHKISQWPASLRFVCCAHFLRNICVICESINEKCTIRARRRLWAFGCYRKVMFLLVVMLRFAFAHTDFLAHLHCVTSECLTGSSQVRMPSVIYRHLCWLKKQLPSGRPGRRV